jgi:hypothetical protein
MNYQGSVGQSVNKALDSALFELDLLVKRLNKIKNKISASFP